MAADIVVRPGWFTPGGAGQGRADATPPMSFPPPWVFMIIKISGLRSSDIIWSPPGIHSNRLHPKAAGRGRFTSA